jgi:hypothetical protein
VSCKSQRAQPNLRGPGNVDAAIEVKWNQEKDKFPESQAAAYACLISKTKANQVQWIPVFVLLKSHRKIGVAFGSNLGHLEFDGHIQKFQVLIILEVSHLIVIIALSKCREPRNSWPRLLIIIEHIRAARAVAGGRI